MPNDQDEKPDPKPRISPIRETVKPFAGGEPSKDPPQPEGHPIREVTSFRE